MTAGTDTAADYARTEKSKASKTYHTGIKYL